jgi:tripartite-type tricarboxylate transporter receptor subunit TctC
VRDGRVRAIAVTSRERNPALPEVPALADTFPGFEITSWGGLVGPAGIPWPVVERASALARRALAGPELIRGFAENGAAPWWTTPEDLASFRAQQDRHFAELVRISGARVD